jgi:hypothetical protein
MATSEAFRARLFWHQSEAIIYHKQGKNGSHAVGPFWSDLVDTKNPIHKSTTLAAAAAAVAHQPQQQ